VDALKQLRVAVIGAGFWGKNHARVLTQLPCTKLVCVCDANVATAESVGSALGVEHTSDVRNVLSRGDVDAVMICTPTVTHQQIATRALMAGKHAFVEKPMTNTVPEAQGLLALAKSKGLRIMPGHIERFNPAVSHLKQMIDKEELGKIVLLSARRVGRKPDRISDVGVVRDTAIHDIDLARYIFEDEVSSVYARIGSTIDRNEDYAEIMLRFRNGGTAFIDANWLTLRKMRTLIVTGSEATAQLDYITQEIQVDYSDRSLKPDIEKSEPLRLELSHFVESILNDRSFGVSGVDGMKAVAICESVIQSSTTGLAVTVAAM
jgi:UDP-N-acetylglucosamine 3-dehydrogenase